MVVMIFPVYTENIAQHLIFAGILVAPVFFLHRKTKGSTLEEMDLIFAKIPEWELWNRFELQRRSVYDEKEGLQQYKEVAFLSSRAR